MNREQLRNKVKSMIRESIMEENLRNYVKSIVTEEVNKLFINRSINESIGDEKIGIKRKAVMNMLKDEKYDHAYLAYSLWHPKDNNEKDTYRSLFSKKATGKPDNDGAIRNFTDDEITKLYELMRKN